MEDSPAWMNQLHDTVLGLLEEVNRSRERYTPFEDYFELRTVEFLLTVRRLNSLGLLPVNRLLEVGCGGGYSLRLWSEIARDVVGSDLPTILASSRAFLADFPPPRGNISLVESSGETLNVPGKYDMILTQYVLEHLQDIAVTLKNLRARVEEPGVVLHVLNSVVDRSEWYINYRLQTTLRRRFLDAIRERGIRPLIRNPFRLRNPFNFTPPHEPAFGDYERELAEYKLEKWALRLYRARFEIVDYFQTRDVNWVFVTRPLPRPTALKEPR